MSDKPDIANSWPFRLAAVFFGLLFAALGSFALLSVIGVLPSQHPQTMASQVFGVSASIVFVCAGLGVMLFGLRLEALAAKLGGIALLAFVLTFNWIAFGPGEREFKRTTSVNGSVRHSSSASELEGRIVFGLFALAMDGVIVYGFIVARRRKP